MTTIIIKNKRDLKKIPTHIEDGKICEKEGN